MITLEKLTRGQLGRDESRSPHRVGIVMDIEKGALPTARAYLRSVGGGPEWDAPLSSVKPHRVSAQVSERRAVLGAVAPGAESPKR